MAQVLALRFTDCHSSPVSLLKSFLLTVLWRSGSRSVQILSAVKLFSIYRSTKLDVATLGLAEPALDKTDPVFNSLNVKLCIAITWCWVISVLRKRDEKLFPYFILQKPAVAPKTTRLSLHFFSSTPVLSLFLTHYPKLFVPSPLLCPLPPHR